MTLWLRSVSFLILTSSLSLMVFADCKGMLPQPGESTHWGGNMGVEMVEDRLVKELRGSVQLGGKPVSLLVDVFPETKNQSSSSG